MSRLKISTRTFDTDMQPTKDSVIDSVIKEHFPNKILHPGVKEHPSVERLFNSELVLSKRVVFGAEDTFQCLQEGLLEEIVLTDTKVVQFKVKDGEAMVEGFAVPELLQGIMTAAPGQYIQLLLEQTPLHSSLTTRLRSAESPPRLTRVPCNTPGSKSLSSLHDGIAGLLKAGVSAVAKLNQGTKRALAAMQLPKLCEVPTQNPKTFGQKTKHSTITQSLALLGCKSTEDFV